MRGCVRSKSVSKRSFSNAYRIEPCAFQKNIFSGVIYSAVETSKNTGDTHWLFGITNHEIILVQNSYFFIQGHKLCSGWEILHDDFISFDRIRIKSMKWLASFVENEIRDVDNI